MLLKNMLNFVFVGDFGDAMNGDAMNRDAMNRVCTMVAPYVFLSY